MRVRLRIGGSETALGPSLPLMGRVLHPDSNRAEWAIVALDTPLSVVGVDIELLCLRPAVAGAQVGDQVDVTVHVAPVVGVGKVEGQPSYKLGELLGQIVCCGVAEAEPGAAADGGVMDGVGRVTAELTFLPKSEGGRNNPPMPPWSAAEYGGYMPHLVVEGGTEYLGVRFVGGPQPVFGEPSVFEMVLMYPGVDYSPLVPGGAVTVREGGRVVARGRVLERG